jgi:hypothetical protein
MLFKFVVKTHYQINANTEYVLPGEFVFRLTVSCKILVDGSSTLRLRR